MKIIQQIIIFFLIAFVSNQLLASPDCWGRECKELHVMAPSGLSMRAKPDAKAMRLLVIPFGKTVQNHGIASEEVVIGGIKNAWVKVTYKGKTGYSFGAYLSNVRQVPSTIINKEVRLEFGMNCDGEINYDPALNWYGIYWDYSAGTGNLRSIKPTLYTAENSDPGSMEMIDYILTAKLDGKEPFFMVGSKKAFTPQSDLVDFSPKSWMNLALKDTILHLGNMRLSVKPTDSFQTEFLENPWSTHRADAPIYDMKITLGSREQAFSFNFQAKGINGYLIPPVSLHFSGDLDGDGITDLLFREGEEESGNYSLYLSSYADGGDILKRVSSRWEGYCC